MLPSSFHVVVALLACAQRILDRPEGEDIAQETLCTPLAFDG
jgi:hypothetical protein